MQSGGNPRTATPTRYEPEELATVSTIEGYSGGPFQFYDVLEKLGEQDHRAPITEEVGEFGEIRAAGVPHSKLSEKSYIQSQTHFDGSVETVSDSDLEDGELQKMLISPLCFGETRCDGRAQFTQADRNGCLRSHSSEGQKALGKPNALSSSEQGNVIRSSVFRNANP